MKAIWKHTGGDYSKEQDFGPYVIDYGGLELLEGEPPAKKRVLCDHN